MNLDKLKSMVKSSGVAIKPHPTIEKNKKTTNKLIILIKKTLTLLISIKILNTKTIFNLLELILKFINKIINITNLNNKIIN